MILHFLYYLKGWCVYAIHHLDHEDPLEALCATFASQPVPPHCGCVNIKNLASSLFIREKNYVNDVTSENQLQTNGAGHWCHEPQHTHGHV